MIKFFIVLILAVTTIVMVWRLNLGAPKYYNSDGSSLWENTMELTKKESIWPYKTVYKTDWNSISMSVDEQKIASSRWFEFVLWNGQGVESIEVTGVDTNIVVYPTDKDPGTLQSETGMIHTSFSNDTQGGKYHIIRVDPPTGETKLRITVTDKAGNITEGVADLKQT